MEHTPEQRIFIEDLLKGSPPEQHRRLAHEILSIREDLTYYSDYHEFLHNEIRGLYDKYNKLIEHIETLKDLQRITNDYLSVKK